MPAVSGRKQCIQRTQQKSHSRKHEMIVSPNVHIPTQQQQHTHQALSGKGKPHTVTGGVTQGDNVAVAMYALSTWPLIQALSYETAINEVKQVWYADDSSAVRSLAGCVKKWWEYLQSRGPDIGYCPKPAKTILLTNWPPVYDIFVAAVWC